MPLLKFKERTGDTRMRDTEDKNNPRKVTIVDTQQLWKTTGDVEQDYYMLIVVNKSIVCEKVMGNSS